MNDKILIIAGLMISLVMPSVVARADLLFSFTGDVQSLTYNGVTTGTPEPFFVGEPVSAQLRVIEPQPATSQFTGFVQFGSVSGENTIIGVQAPGTRVVGTALRFADFCCNFNGLTFNGLPFENHAGENGQALFGLGGDPDTFVALYLPTGQTHTNVTATGTGTWSMAAIPEPDSIALLGAAIVALGLARRRFARQTRWR